jgi:hypothetical protein
MFWWWMPFLAPLEAVDDDADQTQHVKAHPGTQKKHRERKKNSWQKGKQENDSSQRRRSEVCPQEDSKAPLILYPSSFLSRSVIWSIDPRMAPTGCMRSSWMAGACRSAWRMAEPRSARARAWINTSTFPEIAKASRGLDNCIVDGEICAVGKDGLTNLSALQAAMKGDRTDKLILLAFVLLFTGGEDLRLRHLMERKAELRTLIEAKADQNVIRFHDQQPDSCNGTPKWLLSAQAEDTKAAGARNGEIPLLLSRRWPDPLRH